MTNRPNQRGPFFCDLRALDRRLSLRTGSSGSLAMLAAMLLPRSSAVLESFTGDEARRESGHQNLNVPWLLEMQIDQPQFWQTVASPSLFRFGISVPTVMNAACPLKQQRRNSEGGLFPRVPRGTRKGGPSVRATRQR